MLDLVTKAHVVGALPAATARSCLPHWLEAAGWATALVSDATAAAVGRLPATPRNPRRHSSSIDVTVGFPCSERTARRYRDTDSGMPNLCRVLQMA